MDKLREYIETGLVDSVKEYLNLNELDQDTLDASLFLACDKKQIEIVKLLLSQGADVNSHVALPLERAIKSSDLELIKLLLRNGADPNLIPNNNLNMVVSSSNSEVISYLIETGLKISTDMIESVIQTDNLEVFQVLISQITNPNWQSFWLEACRSNSDDIIEYILDLPIELKFDNSTINYIVSQDEITVLKNILNRVPDPLTVITYGHLEMACKNNSFEMIKLLLELGVNPIQTMSVDKMFLNRNRKLIDHPSLLDFALDVFIPSLAIVKLLLEYGVKVTYKTLMGAYGSNNEKIFHLIYQLGSWSTSQLSWSLYESIVIGIKPEIWKFIQRELGTDLEEQYLKWIVQHTLANREFDKFEYFLDFYGEDRIKEFIDFNSYDDLTVEYLKKKFNSE